MKNWQLRIGFIAALLALWELLFQLKLWPPYIFPSMSSVAIFRLINKYGNLIGVPGLAPHDLRRTFSQLGYEAGVPITQVSKLLGHANVATTQRYLNLDLNLESTASDFVPLSEQ